MDRMTSSFTLSGQKMGSFPQMRFCSIDFRGRKCWTGKPKQSTQTFDQNTSIVNRSGQVSARVLPKPGFCLGTGRSWPQQQECGFSSSQLQMFS